jgi:hypothetical protein
VSGAVGAALVTTGTVVGGTEAGPATESVEAGGETAEAGAVTSPGPVLPSSSAL